MNYREDITGQKSSFFDIISLMFGLFEGILESLTFL